ncbi:MAG: hypothetical protein FD189_558 [Elusimicrobia bacterium]|nr:MAG: hypothetical protein FD154_557 [Elusimicrobiota bacterium]KAF0157290.1 MAG: hypothetical protein FD189_558 [Elusimicrobiota bacterium]
MAKSGLIENKTFIDYVHKESVLKVYALRYFLLIADKDIQRVKMVAYGFINQIVSSGFLPRLIQHDKNIYIAVGARLAVCIRAE